MGDQDKRRDTAMPELNGHTYADHMTCQPGKHDFLPPEDPHSEQAHRDGRMACSGCDALVFYCTNDNWYHHAGKDVPACFLAQEDSYDLAPLPEGSPVTIVVDSLGPGCRVHGTFAGFESEGMAIVDSGDGTRYVASSDTLEHDTGGEPAAGERFCEHRPYPGAGYHCLLNAGHYPARPHSDLTICWDDAGSLVNGDGTPI